MRVFIIKNGKFSKIFILIFMVILAIASLFFVGILLMLVLPVAGLVLYNVNRAKMSIAKHIKNNEMNVNSDSNKIINVKEWKISKD